VLGERAEELSRFLKAMTWSHRISTCLILTVKQVTRLVVEGQEIDFMLGRRSYKVTLPRAGVQGGPEAVKATSLSQL
jgi:hypothetical protein